MDATDEVLTLPVPEILVATYAVVLPAAPTDVDELAVAAADGLTEPLRSMALQLLRGPLLTVEAWPADEPLPVPMLEIFGATPEQLAVVSAARHVIAVHGLYHAGWPPLHEWTARGVATGIAESLGGLLVDLFTPTVLDLVDARESLPDEWGAVTLTEWLLVPQSPGDRGFWFTTKGLARLGLPELQILDVPPMLASPVTAALSGIAAALVAQWTGALDEHDTPPPFVQLPTHLKVSENDVALAYSTPPSGGGSTRVRLRLDPPSSPDDSTFLTVVPPDDYPHSAGEFVATMSAALFGATESHIRWTTANDEMERAMATARAGLPQARARFIAGAIAAPRHLIVKHGLPVPDGGVEYVWSAVTAWPVPERLNAVSMSDAESDPTFRSGRPVHIGADAVVDWAVWIDGEGVIEGGWTNRLLTQ